jgi:hypothetical protein
MLPGEHIMRKVRLLSALLVLLMSGVAFAEPLWREIPRSQEALLLSVKEREALATYRRDESYVFVTLFSTNVAALYGDEITVAVGGGKTYRNVAFTMSGQFVADGKLYHFGSIGRFQVLILSRKAPSYILFPTDCPGMPPLACP